MPNLDIYQKFLSNLIFVGLVLTMTFYWAGLLVNVFCSRIFDME